MGKSVPMNPASAPTTDAWPWPPAIRASAAWHVAAIGAGVLVPGALPWAVGAIVLNHALITGAGLTPRSSLLGPNVTRLPEAAAARREVAITIDDGPEPEVTPRVLDLLDAHGQRATFFCIAERVLAHPALAREIVARGHSIQNHTARHRHNFSFLGPRGFAAEIARIGIDAGRQRFLDAGGAVLLDGAEQVHFRRRQGCCQRRTGNGKHEGQARAEPVTT